MSAPAYLIFYGAGVPLASGDSYRERVETAPAWAITADERAAIFALQPGDALTFPGACAVVALDRAPDGVIALNEKQRAAVNAWRAPVTLGNRLMPGCTCGAAESGDFERCRCD